MSSLLVSQAFDEYRDNYIVFKGQSVKTEESYRSTRNAFLSIAGDMPLENVDMRVLRDWKITLERKVCTATLIGYLKCFRRVLRYFWLQQDYSCLNPDLIPIPERPESKPDFLNPDEVTKLIELAAEPQRGRSILVRKRNQAIIALLYASGIRASELIDMNREDLQPDRSFTVRGKRKQLRLCFYDARAERYINEYLNMRADTNHALFASGSTGSRISPSMFKSIFCELSKVYGKRIHAHMFRHSFATNLLRNGTHQRYLLDFLGHKDFQTIKVYTHVTNEDLRHQYLEKHTV